MRKLFPVAALALLSTVASAQDALIDIDIDKTEWYENPILWIAVAAVFIILILVTRTRKT